VPTVPVTPLDLDRLRQAAPADIIPLQYQAQLLQDEHRMDAFHTAITNVVRPGMHVLDLGTGTGILSYFAARQGASVTAVEREPGVYRAARSALTRAVGEQARVVHADARAYTPSTPVDVVVCEMLHTGLLRERQVDVIRGFQQRYTARFAGALPRFLPAGCVQAVQPVQQDFTFHGYEMPAPIFQHAFALQPRTVQIAPPRVYQQFYYADVLPGTCTADLEFRAARPGLVNAIRLITKNLLAIRLIPAGSVNWLMGYLVVPLRTALTVAPGDRVRLTFGYRPGDEISVLMDSAEAVRC
jgi:protein arginine N-methyltransferase 1